VVERECNLRFKVRARAQMLPQPLERDDSYENSSEAEYETEEPEGVDADIRGGRNKLGGGEDVRSVYSALELSEDARQEYLGWILLQSLVRLDNECGNNCREKTSLQTTVISKFRCGGGGQTHEDQKVLNLVLPCFTSRFILLHLRFQQQDKWISVNLWERILGKVA